MLAALFLIKNIILWPNVREPEAWALPFWSQSLFETTIYFHFSELGRNSNSVWRRKNNIQENLRLSICKTMSWAGNLRLLSVILTNLLWLSGTITVLLLPKLFWPTVRKNCSSDREKLLKFEAEGQEFAQFIQTVKVKNNFG